MSTTWTNIIDGAATTVGALRGETGATGATGATGPQGPPGTVTLADLSGHVATASGATASRSMADRFGDIVSVKEFGAVGDGTTDDAAAIQAALDTTATCVIFPPGAYRITTGLTSSVADRTIRTDGAKILCATSDMIALTVSGARNNIHVSIDGAGLAAGGVSVTGAGCVITGCTLANFTGTALGSFGVKTATAGGAVISNNTFRNITATSNAVLGDSPGSARAIAATSVLAATAPLMIENNMIDMVTGEEGDAIQLLFYDGTFPFLDAQATISGNLVKDCNRRGIKIQASNVLISGNRTVNTLLVGDLPSAVSLINIISSNDVSVIGNHLDARLIAGIAVAGQVGTTANRIVIRDNTIRCGLLVASGGRSATSGVFLDYAENCEVSGNTIYDGVLGIGAQNSLGITIRDNTLHGGDNVASVFAINVLSSCSNFVISRNVAPTGARTYLVQNAAPNCIVEDNHARWSVGGCIRTYVTSTGSIYRGNTNSGAAAALLGDVTGQVVFDHRNMSTASSAGASSVMFTADIPSTSLPTRYASRGDIAFSTVPAAAGTAGWVCITAGTPGTWKVWGSISA